MDFVSRFLKSNWIKEAMKCAYNPKRLKALVLQLGLYLSKKGVSGLKEQTELMYNYLKDIATGKYKDYNIGSLVFIIAGVMYLLCPVDFIFDFLPVGLIDDMTIILWVLNTSSNELKRYVEKSDMDDLQSTD